MGQELTIKNVNKSFEVNGEKINVLNDINLDIKEGEFVVLVGHSGCGKSTLLKIIAGLEKNDTGLVAAGGQEITEPAADRGMIFQEHRLFPWMSIERNVQLGLKGLAREEKKKLSDQYLELVKLSEFKKPIPVSCPVECPREQPLQGHWQLSRKYCFWMNHLELWMLLQKSSFRRSF